MESQITEDISRGRVLSWLASMAVASKDIPAAEGYLLELLAWVAYRERDTFLSTSS